jgi:hypothetical protein
MLKAVVLRVNERQGYFVHVSSVNVPVRTHILL